MPHCLCKHHTLNAQLDFLRGYNIFITEKSHRKKKALSLKRKSACNMANINKK